MKKTTALLFTALVTLNTIIIICIHIYSTFLSIPGVDKTLQFVTIRLPLLVALTICNVVLIVSFVKDNKHALFKKSRYIILSIISVLLCVCISVLPSCVVLLTYEKTITSTNDNELHELQLNQLIENSNTIENKQPVMIKGYKIYNTKKYEASYETDMDIRKYINPIDDEKHTSICYNLSYLKSVPKIILKMEKDLYSDMFNEHMYWIGFVKDNESYEYIDNNVSYRLFYRDEEYKYIVVFADNGKDLLLLRMYLQDDYNNTDFDKDDIILSIKNVMEKA